MRKSVINLIPRYRIRSLKAGTSEITCSIQGGIVLYREHIYSVNSSNRIETMNRRKSLRPALAALRLSVSALVVLVWLPAVAAQSASPTAVPTEAPRPTDGSSLALLGFLIASLIVGGLLIGAFAGLVSITLIELVGPFSDRTHLALPVVVGSIPTVVLVNSFGIELTAILVLTELVVLPVTGLFLRRRYSR
jgi:hypothetical protein